ncbi:MAG TPA: universal stress protein [Gemmatimonadales bacterium]|nr:universal stress protein [Gemmatimonadales bacterium]
MATMKSAEAGVGQEHELLHPLLVPLDGSALAAQALPVAAAIARRSGTKLHLAMVSPQVPSSLATGEEPPAEPALEQELRDELLQYLKSTADALGTTHGLDVTFALLDGAPVHALAEHARLKHAGLIVMTTHGHTGVNRLWLGSVADRLLRRVRVPVLLLRPKNGVPHTEFRQTLVALDGLAEGERILDPAIELASLTSDAHFTLVQVVEPPVSLITRMAMSGTTMRQHWRDLQENCARSYLERVATRMRKRGLSVTTQMLSGPGVGEAILGLAHAIGADLVVVGTHGARGVERMLLGSVADKVIRGASQAVLVVPTQREDG